MNNITIRIAGIVNDSITDGPGLRLAIFTQGCMRDCEGCHNKHTHDPNGGKLVKVDEITDMIDRNALLEGITFSGGEPFLQAKALSYIASYAQDRKLSVITYTGYLWEELISGNGDFMALIEYCDYIIDGRYEESLHSMELYFKGSSNQRIIDVKQSLQSGKVCESESLKLK